MILEEISMTKIDRRWTVAVALLLVTMVALPAVSDEVGKPRLGLACLTNPTTAGVTFEWEKKPKLNDMGLSFDIDGLYPFEYHPDGYARLDLGASYSLDYETKMADTTYTWTVSVRDRAHLDSLTKREEYVKVISAVRTGSKDADGNDLYEMTYAVFPSEFYKGSLNFHVSGETAPNPISEDWFDDEGPWNVNIGLQAELDVPFTRMDPVGELFKVEDHNRVGANPLSLILALKWLAVREPEGLSEYRADFGLKWTIPLFWKIGFYPEWQVGLAEDIGIASYFRGEVAAFYRQLKVFGVDGTPIMYVRYVDGRRAPNFEQVSSWEPGIGIVF